MAIEIIWSSEALKSYDQNIQYLSKEWSPKEVDSFLKQTDYVLSRLQEQPRSFSPSPKSKSVRRARMNKYITLYYRYFIQRKQIILLSFWNTKQDPQKLKY
jgi:plasmid stabilization system protein ParE